MPNKPLRSGAQSALTELAAGDGIDERYIVPGLTRGLALLMLFTRNRPAWTLSELAAALDITRSAVYRIVYTLEKAGFIARDGDGRAFRLTSRVLSLGFAYLGSISITEIAQPFLRELSEKTRMSAYVATLEQCEVVYLARAVSHARLVSNLQVGTRQAAHLTASGRVLLAALDVAALEAAHAGLREVGAESLPALEAFRTQAREDRRRGHVAHLSVFDAHTATCAFPVQDGSGATVAAITVIGPESEFAFLGGNEAVAAIVGETAAAISRSLGRRD